MSIFLISDTGPFMWILFLSSIEIVKLPNANAISVVFSTRLLILAAAAVAQAAVPQALVSPAPLSQTFTFIKFLFTTLARVTLHFSGNSWWFSIFGPILCKSNASISSTKKIMCGLPTFMAVPPICLVLFCLKFQFLSFVYLVVYLKESLAN